MSDQQFFYFTSVSDYKKSDMIIGDFNKLLVTFLFDEHEWLTNTIIVIGNEGVGKTFVLKSYLRNKKYCELDIKGLSLIEIDKIIANYDYILLENIVSLSSEEEKMLFALYNFICNAEKKLIITTIYNLDNLNIKLKDLKSRLDYATCFFISEPDENSLKRIFFKNLSDRQLNIDINIFEYIFRRVNRDGKTIKELSNRVDYFIMKEKKKLTIKNINKIISI